MSKQGEEGQRVSEEYLLCYQGIVEDRMGCEEPNRRTRNEEEKK